MRKNFLGMLSLVAALILTSCGSGDKYLEAIPEGSLFIGKVNFGQMLNKAEVLEDPMVKQGVGAVAGFLPADISDLVKDIVADPNNSGIDINKPVVIAVDNMVNPGGVMTMAIGDKSKLENLLNTVVSHKELGVPFELEQGEGYTTIVINGNIVAGAYDDNKLVFAAAQNYIDATRYMNLASEKQAVKSGKYDKFFSTNADIVMAYDYEQYMNLALLGAMSAGFNLSEMNKYFKGMVATVSLNFENGAIVMKAYNECNDEIKALNEKYISTPSGDLCKYIPQNASGVMSLSLKNLGDLVEEFMPADVMSQAKEAIAQSGVDFSFSDLNEFEGDIIGAMLPFELCGNGPKPMFALLIQTKGRKCFDLFVNNVGKELNAVDTDVYAMGANKYTDWEEYYNTGEWTQRTAGTDYYFGYKDNYLFIVPSTLYPTLFQGGKINKLSNNFSDSRLAKEVKGFNSVVFDIQAFCNEPAMAEQIAEYNIITEKFDYFMAKNESYNEGELAVYLTNKKDNALKQIVDMVKTCVAMFN